MRVAVFNPFLGEFGWQLMRWQGYARMVSKKYKATVVICERGYEFLYKDFADDIVIVNPVVISRDCWHSEGVMSGKEAEKYSKYQDKEIYDIYEPCDEICKNTIKQEFISYGNKTKKMFDVVIHARNDGRCNNRNWSIVNWEKLFVDLPWSLKVCSIGDKNGSLRVGNTVDMRGIPLDELADVLHNSTVCVGPSSGPMHFASLCECPQIVWTDDKKWGVGDKVATNRERYEKHWNPFGIPVTIMDKCNWQPSVNDVRAAILEYI